ncbi:PTS galactitol transporter subunit IIA [Bacillus sp. V3-13]|nr:PTS galactitol transporter subunit IIA [Bacillus sp. V3-13]
MRKWRLWLSALKDTVNLRNKAGRIMELFSELFNKDLILTNLHCSSKDDFFEKVSNYLMEKGYVKENFKKAIMEREQKYPTGLRTDPFHVAIPHTDPENILTPFIMVVRPDQEIEFVEMGTDDQAVKARFIFVLGLNKSEAQAPLLEKLIEMFMNSEAMNRIVNENDENKIMDILKKNVA